MKKQRKCTKYRNINVPKIRALMYQMYKKSGIYGFNMLLLKNNDGAAEWD